MGKVKPNGQQQLVLNHKAGPLLVVAGAGTGKTFVIVEKIKKLLDEGFDPSSILAVTFTEKAAAEMLERLLKDREGLLADMPIMTFNGFGESLLREFGSHIGFGRNFRLLGEQAQLVFVRERIDKFKLDYFLPLSASPDAVLKDILEYFSALKQQVVTPEVYLMFAKAVPATDDAGRADKKQHQELAQAYQTYIQICRQENVVDYDDQIYLLIELLNKRPNIQKQLQQRYQAIFVDEFQDTNPMQSKLIDMLVPAKPNLVVVGDDDQSIYGFRGATLANILSFKTRYPNTKEVPLIQNFRSGQAILDAAYKLIQHNNPDRLESTLKINKRLESDHAGQAPKLIRFSSLNEEMGWLAADIAAKIKKGVHPGDIAVLTRRRQTANLVHAALEQAEVSHQLIGYSQNLYEQPVVRMLVELCRTLAEPTNNNSLYHTLTGDLFNIDNGVLAESATKARYNHELLEDLLLTEGNTQAVEAIGQLRTSREQTARVSVGRLLYGFLDSSGYKDRLYKLAESDPAAAASLQHLSQFFASLKDFESIANQPTAVQYLQALPALQAAGEQTEDGTLAISPNEVSVLTIHKSKGLEWEEVYIPDCTEFSFPLKNTRRGLQVPESLKVTKTSPADEHYAEERRLMYVAVTRTKSQLTLSFSDRHKLGGTPRKPSRFLNEMFGETEVTEMAFQNTDKLLGLDLDSGQELIKPVTVPADIFDGRRVYLTVSQAATLINCPRDFYYKFVLKAPQEPNTATAYGTVIHGLIEQINQARISSESLKLSDLQAQLKVGWDKSGYVSKAAQERAFAQAETTLKRFFDKSKHEPIPAAVELPFSAELEPESVVLRGRYDVVFEDKLGSEIRDYKTTTSVTTDEKAKKRAQSSDQLTMYALAWQVAHDELPANLSLEFVDTNLIGSVRKTERGVESLRAKLGVGADQIRAGHFPLGSKHDYCIHPFVGV